MADSSQYNLSLVITANNKAVEELNKIGASVENVKGGVMNLSETTKTTLKTVGATATAISASVVALGKAFVDASLENEPIQKSFERLSESANIASDEMLNAMRKASQGTVADTQLMSAANKAYSLGIVKSADDMATIMEIARLKGQAMGRTMDEALDDIVTGLGRGSAQILDNLGIVIKSSDAYAQYADEIGKSVDELTEAEKKQALVNAVVSQGKEELANAGEVELTMAERIAQVNTTRENMKNTLGDALIPVLQQLLGIVEPIISSVSERISENPELASGIFVAIGAVSGLVAVMSGLALALPGITTAIGVLTGPIGRVIAAIGLLAVARANDRGGIQEATDSAITKIKETIQPALETIQQRRTEHGETVMIYVQELLGRLADSIGNTLATIISAIQVAVDAINVIADLLVGFITGDFSQLKEDLISLVDDIDSTLTEAFGQMRENIKSGFMEGYTRIVNKLQSLVDLVSSIVSGIRNARSNVKSSVSDFVSTGVSKTKSLIKSLSGGKASGGDVYGGNAYVVGEHGPELFIPNQSGSITPNNQITNNNGIEINISGVSVRSDNDIQAIADEIVRKIKLEKEFGIA